MKHNPALRMQVKAYAAEARCTRLQENGQVTVAHNLEGKQGYEEAKLRARAQRGRLHRYRTHTIRKAARATHLAYALLGGRAYKEVEQTCKTEPVWSKVAAVLALSTDMDVYVAGRLINAWRAEHVV